MKSVAQNTPVRHCLSSIMPKMHSLHLRPSMTAEGRQDISSLTFLPRLLSPHYSQAVFETHFRQPAMSPSEDEQELFIDLHGRARTEPPAVLSGADSRFLRCWSLHPAPSLGSNVWSKDVRNATLRASSLIGIDLSRCSPVVQMLPLLAIM